MAGGGHWEGHGGHLIALRPRDTYENGAGRFGSRGVRRWAGQRAEALSSALGRALRPATLQNPAFLPLTSPTGAVLSAIARRFVGVRRRGGGD